MLFQYTGKYRIASWMWKLFITLQCILLMTRYRVQLQQKRFPVLAAHLGEERKNSLLIPLLPASKRFQAVSFKAAIRRATKLSPWHLNCLAQALCAAHLMRHYQIPYALFFGVRHAADKATNLEAHAWVMAGSCNVCGGLSFGHYAPLNCFTYHA